MLRGCLASGSDSWILVKPWQGDCLTAWTVCWSLQGSRPRGAAGTGRAGRLTGQEALAAGPPQEEL